MGAEQVITILGSIVAGGTGVALVNAWLKRKSEKDPGPIALAGAATGLIDDLRKDATELRERLRQLDERVRDLETRLREERSNADDLRRRIEELERENAQLRGEEG